MNKRLFLILLFSFIAIYGHELLAAGMGGPPNNPCGTPPYPPCPVPVDGGISLLAGVGLLYAGKKLYNMKNPD